jgi:hypothetical protein
MTAPSILNAIDDERLFAPWFKDRATWSAWRVLLASLFALPMTDAELATFRECTARIEPPSTPATEAWLICGRRAGKSFTLALIAVYLACFHDYRQHLSPGERGMVLIVATDRKQARTILRYIRALLTRIPMLARMIEKETAESFDLTNAVTIEIGTASFKSVRGYTTVAALLDELAFWPTDDSADPDYEVINAIRPGMATIPNAMLLCASSPYAKKGALHDAFKKHYGKDRDPILVWKAATRQMNPTVPQSVIDEATEKDAANASSEWGANFRDDISQFISRENVLACVEVGVRERPPQQGIKYFSFVDPSGGSSDSAVAVVGHVEGSLVVVDAIREILSPHDPESAVDEFVTLFKAYNVRKTNGDRYAAKWSSQAFEKRKIEYQHSELPTSQLYLNILPHINAKTIRLLDNPRAINQFAALERRTSRGGRDVITHPSSGHDDVANAIAGFAYVAINLNFVSSLPVPDRYVYRTDTNGVLSAIEPDRDERYLRDDPFLQRESQRRVDALPSSRTTAKRWVQ